MVDDLQKTTPLYKSEAYPPQQIAYSPSKLREIRRQKKLSQVELARYTSLSRMTIQACERPNANPTYQVLRALGQALDVVWAADWQHESPHKLSRIPETAPQIEFQQACKRD